MQSEDEKRSGGDRRKSDRRKDERFGLTVADRRSAQRRADQNRRTDG